MKDPKPTLRFGPGGVPLSTKQVKDPETGKKLDMRHSAIYRLAELELNHMEVEFVHGVRIKEEDARHLGELGKKHDISLTIHGSYYINLASKEKPKYYASINRVKKAITAGHWIGSPSVTFHPAYYQGRTPEETTEKVKDALTSVYSDRKLEKTIGGDYPLLSLETTGKGTQWGALEEILDLAQELNQELGAFRVSACVDFAHLHARSNGGWNSYDEFMKILDMVREKLGDSALETLHMHMSGINYGEKGERNHLNLEESDMKWKELLKALKEQEVGGWLTCETPNLEEDAMLMRDFFSSLELRERP
jgi:deoxyribonuclease IV